MKTLKFFNSLNTFVKRMIVIIPIFLITITLSAQESNAYEKVKNEMEKEFGMMPIMFKVYPKHALPSIWENYKQLTSSDNKIPAKYRELIGLAVSAQIPCEYCTYFHTASAKAHGATDEEIQEAIVHGAQSRLWSTVYKGNQIEFKEFEKEAELMKEFMSKK